MTAHRLVVSHNAPADRQTFAARATLARTVHALSAHGQVELVAEHSHPSHCSWVLRASDDTRAALLMVAQTLPHGLDWVARWEAE